MDRDARRLAMLREMGIRLWLPPQAAAAAPASAADAGTAVLEDEAAPRAPVPAPASIQPPHAGPPRTEARAQAEPPPLRPPQPVPAELRRAPPVAPPAPAVPVTQLGGPLATMDWAELRETVAGCRACGLCESRRQTVFGVGHEQADWMIVGEAPGEQEDLRGEPFVGPSGELLDNMLRAAGLSRQPGPPDKQVFIANVIKCRPPHNRNPEPAEVAQCEPYLLRQVELVRPRIILAMGRFAVQSLLRTSEPIGKLRGRVHRYHGVPVIVTYHPAYLLRNLPDKARAWDDLCLAMDTARGA
ncbi:uracil-DNA glycosylase [Caldimonas tepidiphila]|uniref:uracil-DNA glycosylase n=1 Tax=Caldimonas tepidiphila TaxID=2315841 RepID=UPI000E5B1809|nr:uracil-DNA glycosylase [Caldimonas tepidiphila]